MDFRETPGVCVLWNRGDAPATVDLVVTTPISRSAEIAVSPDPATTPGATTIQPGLWRWRVTVPAGGSATVSVGWRIRASGGMELS
jgi:hypothetical protein